MSRAAFSEIGGWTRAVAFVVHQHTAKFSVWRELAHEDGQPGRRRIELTFIENGSADIAANVDFLVLHQTLAKWHEIKAASVGHEHHHGRGGEHRREQLGRTEARCGHHGQFAVGVELVQAVEGSGKVCDRQDHDEQTGNHEKSQVEERRRGLASIDHEVEEPQRLGKPDDTREKKDEEPDGSGELAQHVTEQSVHGAFRRRDCRNAALSPALQIALN